MPTCCITSKEGTPWTMQARTATAAATGPSQLALLSTCSARFTVASAATTMPVAARAVSSSGAQVRRVSSGAGADLAGAHRTTVPATRRDDRCVRVRCGPCRDPAPHGPDGRCRRRPGVKRPGTVRDTWGGPVRRERSSPAQPTPCSVARRRDRRRGRNPTWYVLGPRDRSLARSAMVGSGTPSGPCAVRGGTSEEVTR